jgi:selenocysteine lyase/cysteine desulfurase
MTNTRSSCEELERRLYTALRSYTNVHRGSGNFSNVTTTLYEKARETVLDYLGLSRDDYTVIFGSTWSVGAFKRHIGNQVITHQISSNDYGLPFGIQALAIRKGDKYKRLVFPSGGGTVTLVSRNMILWSKLPAIAEAGTPNILGAIAFAIALKLMKRAEDYELFMHGKDTNTVLAMLRKNDLSGSSGTERLSGFRDTLVARSQLVPASGDWLPNTYLDNAASTPTSKDIWDVACSVLKTPESRYRSIIEEVKSICSSFFDAPTSRYHVYFTQNTTEGINVVAEALRRRLRPGPPSQHIVLNTMLEHNSNELPWRCIRGVSVLRMGVDTNGFVDLNQLEKTLYSHN